MGGFHNGCHNSFTASVQLWAGVKAPGFNKFHNVSFGNYVIFFVYNNECLDIVTIIEGHRDIETMFEDL